MNTQASFVKRACVIVGSQAELARRVGVTPQMVTKWLRGEQVTAERAVDIERATEGKIKRSELRPDIFENVAA